MPLPFRGGPLRRANQWARGPLPPELRPRPPPPPLADGGIPELAPEPPPPRPRQKKQGSQEQGRGMNREGVPGKSPEEMYIQQKVRVLLMLRKMGSNLTASEEAFLRTYAGVVNSQLSQLPQHAIDQGAEDGVMAFSKSETEDRRQ